MTVGESKRTVEKSEVTEANRRSERHGAVTMHKRLERRHWIKPSTLGEDAGQLGRGASVGAGAVRNHAARHKNQRLQTPSPSRKPAGSTRHREDLCPALDRGRAEAKALHRALENQTVRTRRRRNLQPVENGQLGPSQVLGQCTKQSDRQIPKTKTFQVRQNPRAGRAILASTFSTAC